MKFQKGNTLGGRKPGTKNKVNQQIRENFLKVLENNIEKIQEDLDNLQPRDRLKLLLDIASFCIPRLKAIEVRDIEPKEEPAKELTEAEAKGISLAMYEKYK